MKTCTLVPACGFITTTIAGILLFTSCSAPSFTSVDLNGSPTDKDYGKKDVGIPYYLPRAFVIVTKNVSYIQTPTIGLTTNPIPGTFDSSWANGGGSQGGNSQKQTGAGSGSGSGGGGSGGTGNGGGGSGGTGRTNGGSSGGASATAGSLAGNGSASGGGGSGSGGGNSGGNQTGSGSGSGNNNGATDNGGSGSGGATSDAPTASATSLMVPGPGDSISDKGVPRTFYTYQIVYLPDTSKRFGLKVKTGSNGELRANINLVNGWMFTGLGPLYYRNSSTADTTTAAAGGVGQVFGTAISSAVQSLIPGAAAAKTATKVGGAAATAGSTSADTSNYQTPPPLSQPTCVRDYAEFWMFSVDFDANGLVTLRKVIDPQIEFTREFYAVEPPDAAPAEGQTSPAPATTTTPQTDAATADLKASLLKKQQQFSYLVVVNVTSQLTPNSLTASVQANAIVNTHTLSSQERDDLESFLSTWEATWIAQNQAKVSASVAPGTPNVVASNTQGTATPPVVAPPAAPAP